MKPQVDSGPNLLLDWHAQAASRRFLQAGVGSIVAHVGIVALLTLLVSLDAGKPNRVVETAQVHRIIVPLIAPPTKLTQKEPNRTKAAKEVKLENLLPERSVAPRVPTPPLPAKKLFQAPPQTAAPPAPKPAPVVTQAPEPPQIQATLKAPQIFPQAPMDKHPAPFQPPPARSTPKPAPVITQAPEPPQIQATLNAPQHLPQSGIAQPPPPKIQTVEKPKLVLETPGQGGSSPDKAAGQSKIPVPKSTVEAAVHSVARGGGLGGVVVGDADQNPSLGDTLRRPGALGRNPSNLEMISDPMGVDFKPYLIRILAQVRQNWFAVIPESVRLGRRGKVVLQFAIDRSGGVPKLVIEMPSGVEALDKAAIAGISASVPFPPLPKEFPGQQIRLKFAFQYNQ